MEKKTKLVSLNPFYEDYIAGRLERKEFEGIIYKAIFSNYPRVGGFNNEDREDFVSWLYPRMSRSVDSYHNNGASFDAYINSIVHMAAREYKEMEARNYHAELAAWITQLPDMFDLEMESGNHDLQDGSGIPDDSRAARNARQLLILVLKCCHYFDESFLESVSGRVGMDSRILHHMIEVLKVCRKHREDGAENLRSLANRQLCRCIFYETTLQATDTTNSVMIDRINTRLEYSRRNLEKTRGRLSRMHLDPSNAMIAELLGISKGTVDVSLHALKEHWKKAKLKQG